MPIILIEAITNSFGGHRDVPNLRVLKDESARPLTSIVSDDELRQVFASSRVRHSVVSGFGTAFEIAGMYTELLLDAMRAYTIPLEIVLEDSEIFERIERSLVKQASVSIGTLIRFKNNILHYKIDNEKADTYRLKSVLRMADLLPSSNHLADLNKLYMPIFSEAELVHGHEKLLESLYQTYDFPKIYAFIQTAPKGDIQIIHALLTVLDIWLELFNQSYIFFIKQFAKQTAVDFKNSELCPQLQIRVDDELGIQYFYRHIVLPTMKRVLAFSQLNSYNQS